MANSIQTNNSLQQWHNQAFADLFDNITAKLPSMTFWAILFSYGATAALNVWAIHLPLYISVPLSIAIQGLRFLTVFTPFLNPHGRASHLPEVIALGASVLALFELSFSLQALGENGPGFWSLFLFGAAILVLSMILELQFINQGKKAFGLTGGQKTSTGAVISSQQQSKEVEQLKNELQQMRRGWMILDDEIQAAKKDTNQGNAPAPSRQRPATANMGHNGYSLNHQQGI